jgi:4a-hydroxytetrahydrobiopterin dehydratase
MTRFLGTIQRTATIGITGMSDTPNESARQAAQPLSNAEVDRRLRELSGWKREDGGLRRRFRRPGFPEAIAFVNAVAELAENAQHHPDIDIRWRTVTLFLTTHEVGGISERDFTLAERIEAVSQSILNPAQS